MDGVVIMVAEVLITILNETLRAELLMGLVTR